MSVPIKTSQWYVFYTNPRAEKVVLQYLLLKGYEVFLPLIKTIKVWKNRQKKLIEEVLFPGYIFVNIKEYEIINILRTPKISSCISFEGKPSTLSELEIQSIKRILGLERDINIDFKFCKGEKVKITSGPLAGLKGILMQQKGKTVFGVQIEAINKIISINISTSSVEKLSK